MELCWQMFWCLIPGRSRTAWFPGWCCCLENDFWTPMWLRRLIYYRFKLKLQSYRAMERESKCSVFVEKCLCASAFVCVDLFKTEIEAADSFPWSPRSHTCEEKKCTFSISQEGGWGVRQLERCRWCWTCWWATNLTSLIWSYQALLQFHGCLKQVGHVL